MACQHSMAPFSYGVARPRRGAARLGHVRHASRHPHRPRAPASRATPLAGPAGTRTPSLHALRRAPITRCTRDGFGVTRRRAGEHRVDHALGERAAHAVGRAQSRPVLSQIQRHGAGRRRARRRRAQRGLVGAERRRTTRTTRPGPSGTPRRSGTTPRACRSTRRAPQSRAAARCAPSARCLANLPERPARTEGFDQRQGRTRSGRSRRRRTPGGSGADGGTPSACPAWWRSLSAGVYHGNSGSSSPIPMRARCRARRRAAR